MAHPPGVPERILSKHCLCHDTGEIPHHSPPPVPDKFPSQSVSWTGTATRANSWTN